MDEGGSFLWTIWQSSPGRLSCGNPSIRRNSSQRSRL
jgi:hypothetical protein